tara:strand:- start:17873 stop:18097 length:225 start_codon:yes stop_codon:yes gene_type:complete
MEKAVKVINKIILPIKNWTRLAINVLAVMVSWFFNKSILWAIFHFLFGVWYLIYRLIIGSFKDGGFVEIINNYF